MDNTRDQYLARLATAAVTARAAADAIDEIVAITIDPSDDKKGEERGALIDGALDDLGIASRCVEAAQEVHESLDYSEGEPDPEDLGTEDDESDDGEEAA